MEEEYIVTFSAQFQTKIRCLPEQLRDKIADINIPEDSDSKYVLTTFNAEEVVNHIGHKVSCETGLVYPGNIPCEILEDDDFE